MAILLKQPFHRVSIGVVVCLFFCCPNSVCSHCPVCSLTLCAQHCHPQFSAIIFALSFSLELAVSLKLRTPLFLCFVLCGFSRCLDSVCDQKCKCDPSSPLQL